MTSNWGHPGLSPRQRTRLEQLYPEAHGIADHSWPYGITVLEFTHAGRRLLLKACESPHHLDRESRAHRNWLRPLANDVPELAGYDADAGLLVKTFIDGELACSTRQEHDPRMFERAGELLARLHRGTAPVVDAHYEHSVLSKTLAWLARAPGLAPSDQLLQVQDWLDDFVPSGARNCGRPSCRATVRPARHLLAEPLTQAADSTSSCSHWGRSSGRTRSVTRPSRNRAGTC